MDFPIKNSDFRSYVSLPEGILSSHGAHEPSCLNFAPLLSDAPEIDLRTLEKGTSYLQAPLRAMTVVAQPAMVKHTGVQRSATECFCSYGHLSVISTVLIT